MIRPLRILIALAAIIAGISVSPSPAAASATCTIHSLDIIAWSEQTDTVNYSADFKCGGSQSKYRVKITMQWCLDQCLEPGCDNGPCITYRPSATTWFDAGTEHSWQGAFNLAQQIDNQKFRVRGDVIFKNGSPTETYYSNQRQV